MGIGLAVGDGCVTNSRTPGLIITMAAEEEPVLETVAAAINLVKSDAPDGRARRTTTVTLPLRGTGARISTGNASIVAFFQRYAVLNEGSALKRFRDAIYALDRESTAKVLRGLFTADGTVANYGDKSQYVSIDSSSITLLRQTQHLLLSFGIKSKLYTDRRTTLTTNCPDGRGSHSEYAVVQMHSLRVSRSARRTFEREIGFHPESLKAEALRILNASVGCYADPLVDEFLALEPLGERAVFDLTESDTGHFVANGLRIHNCSEYIFIDDTACNLSSLNFG